ncbi:MAG TPA: DUF4012 domain-containing protein, partial [Acidimicrobiales bacterium]|nr:DUF4012 domain-containing protein [Acidimicrobiales bacterium]
MGGAFLRFLRFWGRHRVAAAVVVVLLVLGVGAIVDLLRMRSDLERGREALSGLELDNLDEGLVPTVEGAAAAIRSADDIADGSPFLKVLSVVPGVRHQIEAVRDLTEIADTLGEAGLQSALTIDEVLQEAGGDPAKRVTLLDTVLDELDRIEDVMADLDRPGGGSLLRPLASARGEVVAELDRAPARLDEARFYVEGLRRLLVGPSRYLVLAANNAEMRGGAGMPLSGGVVSIANGDIEFGDFVQLAYQQIGRPPVSYPKSWEFTYHRWSFGRSFPETAVSPNFPITAPMYQAMGESLGFGEVDGVLQVDAVALRHLLDVIGPVELDGVRYDASNVERKVLNESYLTFDTFGERDLRVSVQANLAKAIFEAFKEREVPVADLAFALREAAQGRHLLAQSDDPAVQELWESVGADGRLPEFGMMVAVENIGGNKLDWFVQPSVVVNVLPAIDGGWKARVTVAVENPVPPPDQISDYVQGDIEGRPQRNGLHRALVAVYMPRAATGVRSLDVPFSEQGRDPPLVMAAKRIDVPEGETVRVAMEFSLPHDWLGAVIIPSGRVRPVQYTVNQQVVTDAVAVPVFWVQPPEPDDTPGAPGVAG